MPESICDLGSSVRCGNTFTLTVGDKTLDVSTDNGVGVNGIAPKVEKFTALFITQPVAQ